MSDPVTPDTFDFVLANELKRAARSQNFVTLVLMEPQADDRADAVREVAHLVSRELRETDLLAVEGNTVSMVLLDADLQNSKGVIERVMSRLDNYQFTVPVNITIGAACCPTDGADVETLRRAAQATRREITRRTPNGVAHVSKRG